MSRPLVVVGDTLLDRDVDGTVDRLCPDAPAPVLDEQSVSSRAGGAGLAASLLAADGRHVVLLTALSTDAGGDELRRLLAGSGVEVCDVGLDGPTPEKVRLRVERRSLLRLDRGARASPVGPLDGRARACLRGAAGVLVSDYGRGMATAAGRSGAAGSAPAGTRRPPWVWDPHPSGGDPVAGTVLVTPSRAELERFAPEPPRCDGTGAHRGDGPARPRPPVGAHPAGADLAALTRQARSLLRRWPVGAVSVTLGRLGALLVDGGGPPLAVPAVPADGDPCGAGDRYASAVTARLADGALVSEAVVYGVAAASAYVAGVGWEARPAAGGAAPPVAARRTSATPALGRTAVEDALALADACRAEGGTVVATGGCFDLLHAGHVALLDSARALGSCLVVCLNSDDSVRRLKGPGRPVVPAAERAAVLRSLAAVDAVAVFDEDTPVELLRRLRPTLFVKGGDYGSARLAEAAVLTGWGGQAVIVPYLAGRSTSALVDRIGTGRE